MKVLVCKVCGEVFIGGTVPSNCPFCGVAQKNMLPAIAWKDENNVELSEMSRKNLEMALELEITNMTFYKKCFDGLSNREVALMFKGLFKVEREHASVFRKILKSVADPVVEVEFEDDALKCLEHSKTSEIKARDFYALAMAEAVEPRVKEVFCEIMATEADHLVLDEEVIKKLNGKFIETH